MTARVLVDGRWAPISSAYALLNFSAGQKRDDHGRWTSGGGGETGAGGDNATGSTGAPIPEQGYTTVDAATFRSEIEAARAGERGAFLSLYSTEEYGQMRCVLTEGGKVGAAVKDHGDGRIEAVSLFSRGGTPGAGFKLLEHLVKNEGVNYLECYGPRLPQLYGRMGFKVEESYPFDRSLAAPDWNYARDGEPNYYTMRLEQ